MGRKRRRRSYLAPLVILSGLGGSAFIAMSEQDSPSFLAIVELPLVETKAVEFKQARLSVTGWGFVEARDTVVLRPQVSGSIVELAPELISGAAVREGQLVDRIDPRAYQIELSQSQAEVKRAQQLLAIELGQQNVARAELELLKREFPDAAADASLALREPQKREREALLRLEQARLRKAQLNLNHTEVRAPCAGRILSEDIASGTYLETGARSMELACLESQRVFAAFPAHALLDAARLNAVVHYNNKMIAAEVVSILPQVDSRTRQRTAIVEWRSEEVPIGSYVEVDLPGQLFQSAFSLPTTALRPKNTVWLLSATEELEIRSVDVLGLNGDRVYIGGGVSEGDHVILSHVANPIAGLRLRTGNPMFVSNTSQ